MAHHQTGTKNSTSKNPRTPEASKTSKAIRPTAVKGKTAPADPTAASTGNTRERTHISTSITTEGEMTANVLL